MDNGITVETETEVKNINADSEVPVEKKRTWKTTAEKHADYQERWNDSAETGAYRKMSDERLKEIFDEQQEKGWPNVRVAWTHLGCADNIVPRLQKKVGAKPSTNAGKKKRCKSAVCRLDEIAEEKKRLEAEEKELLEAHDSELAKEQAELEEQLAKIKAARSKA